MFQAQDFTEEQTMIAGFLQQLGKNFDESYFLQTTKRQEFPQSHWDAISAEGYLGINTP